MKSSLRRKEPQRAGSLARKMLRFLGIARTYVEPIGTKEEDVIHMNLSLDYSDFKLVEAAVLEVEHQKAKAITQIRRHKIV